MDAFRNMVSSIAERKRIESNGPSLRGRHPPLRPPTEAGVLKGTERFDREQTSFLESAGFTVSRSITRGTARVRDHLRQPVEPGEVMS